MSGDDLTKMAEDIRALLETRLRIKGRSLAHQLYKAGRQLPKRVRTDANYIVRALEMRQNPKLARMIDENQLQRANRTVVAYLETIDPTERLKTRVLHWLGAASAFAIILFVILVWVAVERGLV